MAAGDAPGGAETDALEQSLVDLVGLHQRFLAILEDLVGRMEDALAATPKGQVPHAAFTKQAEGLGRILAKMIQEGRQLEKSRRPDEGLTDKELLDQLKELGVPVGGK